MEGRRLTVLSVALVSLLFAPVVPGALGSHGDGRYDIPVWFEWHTTTIDVLIVPPPHGQIINGNGLLNGGDPMEATPLNSYLDAVIESSNDWVRAINTFGPQWLRDGVDISIYTVGVDVDIPPEALADPEVLIVADETKGPILGIAIHPVQGLCIVDNSMMLVGSFTDVDMYNINGQELGHCLGLEHVVDNHPTLDVMNGLYPHSPGNGNNPKHCYSNLDVLGLERVWGEHFDMPAGGTASIATSAYTTMSC